MEASVIASIIAVALSFISTITLGLFQLRLWKSQAKKTDVDTSAVLIDKALTLSKQEIEVLRQMNDMLLKDNALFKAQIKVLEEEKRELRLAIDILEEELEETKRLLDRLDNK